MTTTICGVGFEPTGGLGSPKRPVAPNPFGPELVSGRPNWWLPGLGGLLVLTAMLYLWDLSASGWANTFYVAVVQAGTTSWKAFFFGCSDAACSITVDKPPFSLWPMMLSTRFFGMSPFAMLLPKAIMGVVSVGLLTASVRRVAGPVAGLVAGAMLALTPIAVLMFKFNNLDAALVFFLVTAISALVRSIEHARLR